ncbi:MAG: YqaJ viral recombinase family protein, partial [Bacteriovoracales bacterium]
MINKLDLIQGTDDWLKFRLSRLGASEVSAALGVSPWRKPKSLFIEKTTGITPNNKSKMQLFELGHSKEIIARNKYEEQTLKKFFPVVITNDDY